MQGNGEERAPKPKKKIIVLLAVAIVLGIAVKYIFFRSNFRYAGTLEATKVDLSARIASSIAKVEVQEGDHVTANEELLSLTCDDTKVASELANINFDRNQKLFKAGTVSQENFDQIKNHKEDADVRMGWCAILSPINGTVLSRYHEPGELIQPGTKLLTLANIQDIWAYIYVPQPDVARLKTGMKLTAHLPEMGDKVYEGKIIKVNDEAEFTPKNVQTRSERERLVFGVKISFLEVNKDEVLKPGMTVEVEIPKD